MTRQTPLTLVLVLASTVTACGSGTEASSAEQKRGASTPAGADVLRFTLVDNGREQSLEVRKQDAGTLDVGIAVAGGCARRETGLAKVIAGAVEVEADADGEGYPTDSFVLTSPTSCRVTIRLAAPDREYAWLRESGCAPGCQLSSKAMARK